MANSPGGHQTDKVRPNRSPSEDCTSTIDHVSDGNTYQKSSGTNNDDPTRKTSQDSVTKTDCSSVGETCQQPGSIAQRKSICHTGRNSTDKIRDVVGSTSRSLAVSNRRESVSNNTSELDAAKSAAELHVYARRWYILCVYALLSFMQCVVWNTFGPIAHTALVAFPSWSNLTVSLFNDMGCITFVVCMVPFCWVLDRYGLRPAILTMAIGVSGGTAVRCITSQETAFTATAFLCAFLNGISGIMAMMGPPYISALWFPPEQRTTATGIPNILNQMGSAGTFLLGPQTVHESGGRESGSTANRTMESARTDIMHLMYTEAAICGPLLVAVLLYFPSRPPLAPSVSAARPTTAIRSGLRVALQHRDLLLVVLVYSMSQGVQAAYFGVLTINVSRLGVTEDQAGWLGFWAGLSCCGAALLAARLTDMFRGHIRLTVASLLTAGTVLFAWQLALVAGWTPYTLTALYCATVGAICCTYACSPLLIEYAAELSYPVPENVIGAILAFTYNLVACLYLLLFAIKPLTENTIWLNYCLVASTSIPILLVLRTDEVHRRTNADKQAGD